MSKKQTPYAASLGKATKVTNQDRARWQQDGNEPDAHPLLGALSIGILNDSSHTNSYTKKIAREYGQFSVLADPERIHGKEQYKELATLVADIFKRRGLDVEYYKSEVKPTKQAHYNADREYVYMQFTIRTPVQNRDLHSIELTYGDLLSAAKYHRNKAAESFVDKYAMPKEAEGWSIDGPSDGPPRWSGR